MTIRTLPATTGITTQQLADGLRRLAESDRPRLQRLWTYYRNPMRPASLGGSESVTSERPYRQGQEWGLPPRITGYVQGAVEFGAERMAGIARKEVVVENDIGWRVDAMVDHLFGRPLILASTATDPARREALGELLWAVLEANGGLAFLQQISVIGMVFGFVDVAVKLDVEAAGKLRQEVGGQAWEVLLGGRMPVRRPLEEAVGAGGDTGAGAPGGEARGEGAGSGGAEEAVGGGVDRQADTGPGLSPAAGQLIERLARLIRLEIIHPSHSLPLGGTYVKAWETEEPAAVEEPARAPWWKRNLKSQVLSLKSPQRQHLEILTPTQWYRVDGGGVTSSGVNSLGRVPVVHVQNLAAPFEYGGRSDVEGLIPLQDELNTRLSDRAHRITMQSFKMFLGKGIDNFLSMPVGPGRMWSTDNDAAEVKEFGGDERCPSEEQHIADVREALDKTSSVPPVAAGLIRDRVGQLSSAAALRVTLQSLLAKTERKRSTYGAGIAQICEMALGWLDVAGLLATAETDRTVDITWPSALPENSLERLHEAEIKARLGVPASVVLREIGY